MLPAWETPTRSLLNERSMECGPVILEPSGIDTVNASIYHVVIVTNILTRLSGEASARASGKNSRVVVAWVIGGL